MEAVIRTWAPSAARIRGTKERTQWTAPKRLTPKVQRQSSSGVSMSGATVITPALLHSRWTAPNASKARSASASTEAGSATSVRAAIASPPAARTAAATRSASASSMSDTATRMPASLQARARASPMPEPPPVITAARPSSCSMTPPSGAG